MQTPIQSTVQINTLVTKVKGNLRTALSALIVPAALAFGTAPVHAQDGDLLRYAILSNPKGTFHPTLYFTDYDRAVIFAVYGRLVTLDEKQNPKPSLAESWTYSKDGRTLTLNLRKGVKWHDGKPFTAEDVAFTYATQAHPDFTRDKPPFVQFLQGFEDYSSGKAKTLSGVKVVSETKVSFTFKEPYAAAFAHFADKPVLAKHVWEKIPVKGWNQATQQLLNPVGTGPYKFAEFRSDQFVKLERNDDYFGGRPNIKTLVFKISNPQTIQNELVSGELDIAEITNWNERDLQLYQKASIRIVEEAGTNGQYLTFDTRNPKLNDKRVRQAIIHAINRKALVERLLFGHGVVFNSNAHPDSPYYPADLNPYEHDAKKSKELLAAAGWKDSDGDGVLDRNGEKFTFKLNVPTGNRTRELSAPIIQQNLKAVGIQVELVPADFNAVLSILQDSKQQYDGVLMGGTFRPGQYENNFWWERFSTPQLTAYADAFNSSIDEAVLRQNVGLWLKGINDEAIRVWLYVRNGGYALGPRVANYKAHPYEPLNDIVHWTVKK